MRSRKKNGRTKKYNIKKSKVSNRDRVEENKNGNRKRKKHPKLKKFIIICFVIFILLSLVGLGVFAAIFFSDEWKVSREDLEISLHNTAVYDKDGKQIAELTGDENRKIITLSAMGKYIPNAFVAIEDERYYTHYGVDIKRTAGAILTYVTHGGQSSFGGSTITQQLVKNMMNDSADSGLAGIERKIREWSRAYQIEQMFSKSQILELYLNKIFMGATVYGVESGSQYYFSKSAKDLNLAESAFIAGINDSPNSYNPFGEEDKSEIIKQRTKIVLKQMKKLKDEKGKGLEELTKITDEEYDKAIEEVEKGLKFKQGSSTSASNISFHTAAAIDQVATELAELKDVKYETARSMVFNGGYKLYTTQDSKIQNIMEKEYLKTKYIKNATTKIGKKEKKHSQSAMTIIDHKTGRVVATVGGLGKDSSTLGLNRATQINRQPGSSIKPLVAVGPALEEKVVTAATIYNDVTTNFGYGPIYNSTGNGGYIPVKHAIERSSNVVNMKVLSNLGPEKGVKYANELGLSYFNDDDAMVGLAIGGTAHGTNPLQMAGAYATIANGGEYIEPTFYTKLESSSGTIVLEPKQEKRRVFSEQNAYILTEILKTPVYGFRGNATATSCKVSGIDTAAKTGTTSDYIDKWLCGFTPYYAASAWFGYDDKEPVSGIANTDNPARTIWSAVMDEIHKDLKSAKFKKPSGIVTAKICTITGKAATEKCKKTYSEYFATGTVPGECEGHEEMVICKDSKLLATEFCPKTEKKTYVPIPEKERNAKWSPSGSTKKNEIITEECKIHTEETQNITVVEVIGKTEIEAKDELIGLNVSVVFESDNSQPNGVVLKQSIAEGTRVKKGTTITITINEVSTSGGNDPNTNTIGEPAIGENTNTQKKNNKASN